MISDAYSGLIAAIRENYPGACWQRYTVCFRCDILAHVPHRNKQAFAKGYKEIWLASAAAGAKERAARLCEAYASRFPKAIETLENSLEDSLSF